MVCQLALIEPIACEVRATKGESRKMDYRNTQAIRFKKNKKNETTRRQPGKNI